MDIIKNNRIVSDITFATRLISFMKKVQCSDCPSEEEKTYIKNVAESLLKFQLYTLEDSQEKEYFEKLGKYPILPSFRTSDGVDLYINYDPIKVYSCMESPSINEEIKEITINSETDLEKINKKRLLFWNDSLCQNYIDNNTKVFSKSDLLKLGIKL